MKTVKVGIIGTGFSAKAHLEALRRIPCVEVAGICGSTPDKGGELADHLNVPRAYDSAEAMLQDPRIESVHNCTPNALHFEINRLALLADKHLLSEKPLSINSKQSRELMELAFKTGKVSGVCFNYRHYPMVSQMKEMLQTGKQGRINLVYGGYLQDWLLLKTDYSWRLEPEHNGPSRAMADIGSHWCDTVQHVLNRKIIRVFADLKTVHPTRLKPKTKQDTFGGGAESEREKVQVDSEDYGSVLVHFEGGTQGVFTVSQVSAGRKNRLHFEVATDRSSFAWDQEKPNTLWVGKRERASEEWSSDPDLLMPQSAALTHYPGGHHEGWPDGLKNLFIDFYKKVENPEHPAFFATLVDGHRNMQLVEAIMLSHREQRWVEVGETVPDI